LPISTVSSSLVTSLPQRNLRPDVVDRSQRSADRDSGRRGVELLATHLAGELGVAADNLELRRVDSGPDVSRLEFQDHSDLPLKTRQALQAFAENMPSPGQQLGIELAGIDLFA
jgi:hypothetical protein